MPTPTTDSTFVPGPRDSFVSGRTTPYNSFFVWGGEDGALMELVTRAKGDGARQAGRQSPARAPPQEPQPAGARPAAVPHPHELQ